MPSVALSLLWLFSSSATVAKVTVSFGRANDWTGDKLCLKLAIANQLSDAINNLVV